MTKVQVKNWNDFCPQQLFLYGTYREDGTPNFGLFCWFSYINAPDINGEGDGMGVMACIGGSKLTKDLIRKNGVFSANLVTEELLPLADYYAESPVSMELQVMQEIDLKNGCDVYLCKIMGETMREDLTNKEVPFIDRFKSVKQVLCGGELHYVSMDGRDLGSWGEPMKSL